VFTRQSDGYCLQLSTNSTVAAISVVAIQKLATAALREFKMPLKAIFAMPRSLSNRNIFCGVKKSVGLTTPEKRPKNWLLIAGLS